MTKIRQDAQVHSTQQTADGFADDLPLDSDLETTAQSLRDDLNAVRSVVAHLLNLQQGRWYTPLSDPAANGDTGSARSVDGLNTGLYTLERSRYMVVRRNLTTMTVGAGTNVLVLGAGELPAQTTIAVGAVATQGTVAAAHGGTFGDHRLDIVPGANGLAPKNLVQVVQSNGAAIASAGRPVWALLHSENATDGHTATETSPDRLQLSFVRPTADFVQFEACPASDIAGKTIRYVTGERIVLQALVEQDLFPHSADQTEGAGGAAGTTLDAVVNAGSPDNDLIVPETHPIVFRDDGVDFTPVKMVRTMTTGGSIGDPALEVENTEGGQPSFRASHPDGSLDVRNNALVHVMPFGGGLANVFWGFQGRDASDTANGANLFISGQVSQNAAATGGDLYLFGGFGGLANGAVSIAPFNTREVNLGGAAIPTNVKGELNVGTAGKVIDVAGDPDGTVTAAKGTIGLDATTPTIWQNKDGADIWDKVRWTAPRSASLTRDGNGNVQTVSVTGEQTWTISRNPDQSVASLTNTIYTVTVNRDGDGVVTGVTAVKL